MFTETENQKNHFKTKFLQLTTNSIHTNAEFKFCPTLGNYLIWSTLLSKNWNETTATHYNSPYLSVLHSFHLLIFLWNYLGSPSPTWHCLHTEIYIYVSNQYTFNSTCILCTVHVSKQPWGYSTYALYVMVSLNQKMCTSEF